MAGCKIRQAVKLFSSKHAKMHEVAFSAAIASFFFPHIGANKRLTLWSFNLKQTRPDVVKVFLARCQPGLPHFHRKARAVKAIK